MKQYVAGFFFRIMNTNQIGKICSIRSVFLLVKKGKKPPSGHQMDNVEDQKNLMDEIHFL